MTHHFNEKTERCETKSPRQGSETTILTVLAPAVGMVTLTRKTLHLARIALCILEQPASTDERTHNEPSSDISTPDLYSRELNNPLSLAKRQKLCTRKNNNPDLAQHYLEQTCARLPI